MFYIHITRNMKRTIKLTHNFLNSSRQKDSISLSNAMSLYEHTSAEHIADEPAKSQMKKD